MIDSIDAPDSDSTDQPETGVRVYLGVGSNHNRQENISRGIQALAALGENLVLSPIYESDSVGFDGRPFYNLVVTLVTSLSLSALQQALKSIEADNGRDMAGPKFGPQPLDIDILLYGDLVGDFDGIVLPRKEIIKNAFVLLPLSDIAPDVLHPILQQSFRDLWHGYDKSRQTIWQAQL